jgi:SAM-dependent methyltransferase
MKATHDNWDAHWANLGRITEENPADKYRYDLILKLLDLPFQGEGCRLVDVGCGDGSFINKLKNIYPKVQVLGVDTSSVALTKAKHRTPSANFVCVDLNSKNSKIPSEFLQWSTHAVCSEVLEHLDDPKGFLLGAASIFGKDNKVVITVPGGPMSDFHRHVGHRRHFTVEAIKNLIEESGLEIEEILRAGFPFFNLYRLATQLRGKRLLEDLGMASKQNKNPRRSLALKFAFLVFRPLFRLNLDDFPTGWQLVIRANSR